MAKNLKVKLVKGDPDSLYKSEIVSLGNKSIITPIKTIDLSKTEPNFKFNDKVRGLNEIYRKIKENRLNELIHNIDRQSSFNYRLNTELNRANRDTEITLLLLEYEGMQYPQDKAIEFLADTIFSYSDIVTLPIISGIRQRIIDEGHFITYKNFLEKFLEIADTINHKPIMGVVPAIGFAYLPDLAEFYIEKGISAFYFDLDGKTPISMRQNIRSFLRSLNNHKMLDKSFIHSINIYLGRSIKKATIIPAKDILSFGCGFDSIGGKHKPRKIPIEYFEKIAGLEENKLRSFNKEDYGYYKISNIELRSFYPPDTMVPIENFSGRNYDIKKSQAIFNVEQQGLEAIRLRKVISNENPKKYLEAKKYVKVEDIKKMIKIKDYVSMGSLF